MLARYEAMAGQLPDIQQVRLLTRSGNSVQLQQTYQAPLRLREPHSDYPAAAGSAAHAAQLPADPGG